MDNNNHCNELKIIVNDRSTDSASGTVVEYAIDDHLVLAGQPQPQDWQRIVQEGFDLVINLRSDEQRAAVEGQNAETAGLNYIHLPLPAYELEAPHIDTFREALQKGNKIYLHCRTASRVALLWMLHRIIHNGWSQEQAEAELRAAGYDDEDMDVFLFCTEDFLERTDPFSLVLP